ncbi:hypothetical protein ACQKM9_04670 [Viridibacillus sp. NPDC093762]|uniref:hypothetical protein n=1 Tax=Viridibacillus sp. NPDC093762 TaxID=3390720 RepID=UPI003D0610BE
MKFVLSMIVFMVTISVGSHVSFANSYEPIIHETIPNTTINFSTKKLTNKPVKVTIDTSNYEGGDHYVYDGNSKKIIKSNKITVEFTKNGRYEFLPVDQEVDEESAPNHGYKWIVIEIRNVDTTKPKIKVQKPTLERGTGNYQLNFGITDYGSRIKTVTRQTSYNSSYTSEEAGDGVDSHMIIKRNGRYKVTATDFAGNKAVKYITVTDYKKAPLKVNTFTSKNNYITGKSMKNTWVSIYNLNTGYRIAKVKTDSNGKFKASIGKQKTGTKLYVWTWHIPEKYVSASKDITVTR